MKNPGFFQEVRFASEMNKITRRNRIDLCDFSKFMLIFKAEVVWIDMIYKMFKPPLVLVLLRDELREHGVYYQCQFWRLVPPHFVYFSLILSKNMHFQNAFS